MSDATIPDMTPEQKKALYLQFQTAAASLADAKEEKYGAPPVKTEVPTMESESGAPEIDIMHLIDVIAALRSEVAALKNAPTEVSPILSQGGAPVPHHLHLVDGRVIQNFDGIATHYSDENGVTRVKAHYLADEPDPSTLFV